MIREIRKEYLSECVAVIRSSFQTVADELGFTEENAPGFTAFSITEERLAGHRDQEKGPMFGYFEDGRIIGYYSLMKQNERECELNHLCVLEGYRHQKIGKQLLDHAFDQEIKMGCSVMNIGIVEENVKLRKWYEANGAEHVGIEKFDFFPFTCGYMNVSYTHL
ncbi:MAG: GNAT family N-acetyltransferase, partial [Lachnospiraceae bacterium]|nr:GNAT family N-acetyltransferase [Lachnospiraceae bacterium]